jgi:Zn finger protein HypA/HybF involved in hydrogenase expression
MSEENIFNNYLTGENIPPIVGIFKTLDYDLNLNERRAKFEKYDYILCEDCNQKIENSNFICDACYNKETDLNEQNRMKFGICDICFKSINSLGCCKNFKTSDYDLNLDERIIKYKHYNHISCEKCNHEINKLEYYCMYCYNRETDIDRRNNMIYGSKFEIFKTSDYDLNFEERKAKYKDFDVILCEECNQEINRQECYCTHCYDRETDGNKRNRIKYRLNFGIFKTLDYDLNMEERKAKYKDFSSILCEKCNLNIDEKRYYCEYCYKKETDISKQNHIKYGLNFGIFNPSDYDLNLEERKEKYKNFSVNLCEKCNQEIDKQYYYCKYCYNKENERSKKIRMKCVFKTGILKISDYDFVLKKNKQNLRIMNLSNVKDVNMKLLILTIIDVTNVILMLINMNGGV